MAPEVLISAITDGGDSVGMKLVQQIYGSGFSFDNSLIGF